MTTLQPAIAAVIARDACSGCGLCTRLDSGITMGLDDRGYLRPSYTGPSMAVADARRVFDRSCPGVTVRAGRTPSGGTRDSLMGAHIGAWQAWANDEEIRHAGSSGGVLTALNTWLLSSGTATTVTGAAADARAPRRTVPVTIMTRAESLTAAGSRYAPVAALDNPAVLTADAVTGKPCEIAALRQAAPSLREGREPLLLSFFCAGTPSQQATDTLLADLGVSERDEVESLRYRGNGWPGRFLARSAGREVSADYDESWGKTLGPTTQWRCKICPDGVGESADVVCADSWETNDRGYPTFTEGAGISALIARTERGKQAILDAAAAGVITIRPLPLEHLIAAQPLQVSRRRFPFARLLGSRLGGRGTPRYRGFGLVSLTIRSPRQAVRMLRGTYRRVAASRKRG